MPAAHDKLTTFSLVGRKWLWRAVWLAVLLLHIPATFRVFSAALVDESKWSAALLILATNVFFAFEIYYCWSFKVLTDRRRVLTFLLIIALLHVGVVGHAIVIPHSAIEMTTYLLLGLGGTALLRRMASMMAALVCTGGDPAIVQSMTRRRGLAYSTAVRQCAPNFAAQFIVPSRARRGPPL